MAWNLFIGYLVALFIGIVIQTMKMLLMSIVRPLLPQWPEGCLHRYIRRMIKIHSAYSIDGQHHSGGHHVPAIDPERIFHRGGISGKDEGSSDGL
jgi:hypothetical protein